MNRLKYLSYLTSTFPEYQSPSNKFVYYVISDHGPVYQAGIMDLTGLNRNTVQNAMRELVSSGIVRESFYRNYLRKKIYSASSNLR